MARNALFLIVFFGLLVSSCADVMPLTGGDEDEFAPKTVSQTPEQGTTFFSGNEVRMTFDENIVVNDPLSTVTMNPSVGKLTTEKKNRTVTVSWEEPLLPNTTYILQFNGTVRDLNEGNDSITQVIFATGAYIDSLGLEGRVVNAFSNQVMNQVSVGLYTLEADPMTDKPLYATRSTSTGTFRFSYLKNAPYQLFAFLDQNKDQLPQATEVVGFSSETVVVGDSTPVVLSLFSPEPQRNKIKVDAQLPGLFTVHHLEQLDPEKLMINGFKAEVIRRFTDDSLIVAIPERTGSTYQIIYGEDTLRKPITERELQTPLHIRAKNPSVKWRQGDSLFFEVNDVIKEIKQTELTVISTKGNPVPYALVSTEKNQWCIIPDAKTTQSFSIHFNKAAVVGTHAVTDSLTFSYATLLPADLSTLKINCPDLDGQWIIELVQSEKALYSVIKPESAKSVVFTELEPGQYNVRCIRDSNKNGKWDTGNVNEKTQAEQVIRYTLTQKLRANWEVEETLILQP
ncbi:MAG: Ig-like domain-containing protein [Bacteroidota bacterium]